MNARIMAREQSIPVFEPETTSKSSKGVSWRQASHLDVGDKSATATSLDLGVTYLETVRAQT